MQNKIFSAYTLWMTICIASEAQPDGQMSIDNHRITTLSKLKKQIKYNEFSTNKFI